MGALKPVGSRRFPVLKVREQSTVDGSGTLVRSLGPWKAEVWVLQGKSYGPAGIRTRVRGSGGLCDIQAILRARGPATPEPAPQLTPSPRRSQRRSAAGLSVRHVGRVGGAVGRTWSRPAGPGHDGRAHGQMAVERGHEGVHLLPLERSAEVDGERVPALSVDPTEYDYGPSVSRSAKPGGKLTSAAQRGVGPAGKVGEHLADPAGGARRLPIRSCGRADAAGLPARHPLIPGRREAVEDRTGQLRKAPALPDRELPEGVLERTQEHVRGGGCRIRGEVDLQSDMAERSLGSARSPTRGDHRPIEERDRPDHVRC